MQQSEIGENNNSTWIATFLAPSLHFDMASPVYTFPLSLNLIYMFWVGLTCGVNEDSMCTVFKVDT